MRKPTLRDGLTEAEKQANDNLSKNPSGQNQRKSKGIKKAIRLAKISGLLS